MKVKELRHKLDLTMQEFAQEVACSMRSIAYWESGDKDIDDRSILRPYRRMMLKLSKKV